MPSDDVTTLVGAQALWQRLPLELARLTTEECSVMLSAPHPTVVLPVGSTEPHGPHLPLSTDATLAEECAKRAARELRDRGVGALAAPALAYGVTRYASGFAGAISLSPALMEQLVRELCVAYREAGFGMVCVTNHHLEPEHVTAITRGVEGAAAAARGGVRFANQLTPRWGRTLSAEFKKGECHAGSYETSLVLAASPDEVRDVRRELPEVPVSLSAGIRAGKTTFRQLGLERAYSGAPAAASREEGEGLYALLVKMVADEVCEGLGLAEGAGRGG
jgi:creatinine amidohydrolase